MMGMETVVENSMDEVQKMQADSSSYHIIQSQASAQYQASILDINNKFSGKEAELRSELQDKLAAAEGYLATLIREHPKHPTSQWYAKQKQATRSNISKLKRELGQVSQTIARQRQAEQDQAQAQRQRQEAEAAEALLQAHNTAAIGNQQLNQQQQNKRNRRNIFGGILVLASVFFGLFRSIYEGIRDHLSQREAIISISPTAHGIPYPIRFRREISGILRAVLGVPLRAMQRLRQQMESDKKHRTLSDNVPVSPPLSDNLELSDNSALLSDDSAPSSDNSTNEVQEIGVDITRLWDRTRKQYARSFTAILPETRELNRQKAEEGMARLKELGIDFEEDEKERKLVKTAKTG